MGQFVLLGAGAVVILLAGAGAGYWIGSFRRSGDLAKATEVQAEFDEYRRGVTEHFSQTAAQFQSLGQQYRALYEHMAAGAERLCDSESLGQALSFEPAAALEAAADGNGADDDISALADAAGRATSTESVADGVTGGGAGAEPIVDRVAETEPDTAVGTGSTDGSQIAGEEWTSPAGDGAAPAETAESTPAETPGIEKDTQATEKPDGHTYH